MSASFELFKNEKLCTEKTTKLILKIFSIFETRGKYN